MSDSELPGWGRLRDWRTRASIDPDELADDAFVRELALADGLSLVSLCFAWTAALSIVSGEPNWGIAAMFAAFLFDKLDGYAARRGHGSAHGLRVDSFVDVFVYLVTAALLYHHELAPNFLVSAVVGFGVVAFGSLRLIRHSGEGFGSDGQGSFYRGITVVHVNLVVVAGYLLDQFVGLWNGWLAGLLALAAAPLMISNYRCYKTTLGHALVAIGGVATACVVLAIELGWI